MKKRFILLGLVVIAVIVAVAFFYKINRLQKELQTSKISESDYIATQSALSSLISYNILQYKTENKPLKGDIAVLSTLQSKSQNGSLAVFRFGDSSCDVCVESAMFELMDFEKFINKDNFLIVVSYQDLRRYRDFVKKFNSNGKYNIINIEYSPYLYIENRDEALPPHFFVLENGNLIPQKLFFYIKECPEMNRKYFELVFGRKQ